MTSEGHPDRARDGYGDAAHDSRGYGMFEPPPAPEEFPVFTPNAPSPFPVFGAEDAPAPAEQPGAFGGFPPDSGAPASANDVYVPAPAVVPLPNQSGDTSGWPAAADSPGYGEPAGSFAYGEPASTYGQPSGYGRPSGYEPSAYAEQPGYGTEPSSYSAESSGYGQESPSYGNETSGYGQPSGYAEPSSSYGQDAPSYGQDAPAYGHETSGYAEPSSSYSQDAPSYGQDAPAYGHETSGYGQPSGYAEPSSSYSQDAPSYGQDAPSYGHETSGYGQPAGYSEPSSAYGQDAPAYGHEAGGYAEPSGYESTGYGEPPQQAAAPAWQSFAPSGPPPASASVSPAAPPEEPAADRTGNWKFDIPAANSTGWSPFGNEGGSSGGGYTTEEPREYTSVFDPPQASAPPAPTSGVYGSAVSSMPPAGAAPVPAGPPPVPAGPAPAMPSDPMPSGPVPSGPVSGGPNPGTGQAPGAGAPQGSGPGAVAKASVPVASRVAPPADGVPPTTARPGGRVYGSAQPPAPPVQPPAQPPASEPGVYGQAYTPPAPPAPQQHNGYHPGQPGTAAPAQPGPAPTSGAPVPGASARASVSVGRVTPGEAPPPQQTQPAQSSVYGRPAQPTVYGAPPAAQAPTTAAPQAPHMPAEAGTGRGQGMSAYSDLLGPAQPRTQTAPPMQPPSIPAQRRPPGEQDADQTRFAAFKPEDEPAASGKGGTAKVLVMVIAACVLLIGLAFGALMVVGKLVGGGNDPLAVGQCVKRQGSSAVVVDCGSADSFKITKKVTNQQDCPNPQNDALTQGDSVFCLEPSQQKG